MSSSASACCSRLAAIFAWLRPPAIAPLQEGRRLIDAIGWAAVLPQMLASLGVLFAAAGVGDAIGALTRTVIPEGSVFLTVAVFGLGMAMFTMVMGNAFAAFPVMAAAIGVPLLIQGYGGDPAVVGAVGMLAGFCGTLMTPMAANFNLVPAALLELKDQYGVIRAQIATALPLLVVNILIIYLAGVPMKLDARHGGAARADRAWAMSPSEYPHKLDHVLGGDEDALPPRALHPIFYGSFDWHSCVHGWWTLLTLRRLFPEMCRSGGDRRAGRRQLHRKPRSQPSWPISTGRCRAGSSGHTAGRGCSTLHLEASRHPDQRMGGRARTPRPRLRRAAPALSRHPDLPDPRRHAFQHGLRAGPGDRMGEAIRPGAGERRSACAPPSGSAAIAIARRGSRAATNSCRRR